MKYLYTSPAVVVEELDKADVLCDSGERTSVNSSLSENNRKDNFNQVFQTLGDFSRFM